MAETSLNFQIQTRLTQLWVPSELIKINFKSIQKLIEKQKKQCSEDVAKVKGDTTLTAKDKLAIISKIVRNFESFQRKLKIAVDKDTELRSKLVARKDNLLILRNYKLPTPEVVKFSDSVVNQDDEESKTPETKDTVAADDILLDLHNPNLINWFREQTNLLIVDYLIKSNTRTDSNIGLLLLSSLAQKNPKFTKLIDYDLFETFNKIFISIIEDHDLTLVINWFNENKNFLKKANSNLEFEINYCKFLSLIDNADVAGATQFSKAYLSSFGNLSNYQDPNLTNYHRNQDKMKDIGGLLLFLAAKLNPESRSYSTTLLMNSPRFHEYELLLSDDRWISLSQCFMDNFTKLYGISKNYPLFIYLSAGLTSLKTKSCFHNTENSIFKTKTTDETDPPPLSNENSPFLTDIIHRGPNHYYKILKKINNCPVCSPELYNISRNLPYAQLITSIFNNPYKLPNGNIYPYDKLLAPTDKYFSEKNTLLRLGKVKDPLTKQLCLVEDCVRVYPA